MATAQKTRAMLKYVGTGLSGSPIGCNLFAVSTTNQGYAFRFTALVTDEAGKVLAVEFKGAVQGDATTPQIAKEQVGTAQAVGTIDTTCTAKISGTNLQFEYSNVGSLTGLSIEVFGEIIY